MGNDVSLSVRVSANLDELRAHMKEASAIVDTTSSAMKSMANAYDGSRTIANANAAMLQVQALGGTANLTEKNQASLNARLTEGLEQYRVLGREAPAGMQKMADETRQVDKASGGLIDTVKQLAAGFGVMFTARAVFNFGKEILADASALKDLSTQTHIGIEEIQLLAGAMSEFGVDTDTLAKGLFGLSRRVAGGDESVAKALALMGMSLQDIDGLNGQELFLKVEHGLSQLQGGLRDTAASDLFGSRLGMAMAGASEGIDGALASARELNTVMSTESVEALDHFDESIDRAERSLRAMAANMVGPAAEAFNVFIGATERGVSKWELAKAVLLDYLDTTSHSTNLLIALTPVLDQLNPVLDRTAKAYTEVAIAQDTVTVSGKELLEVQKLIVEATKQVDIDFQAAAHQLGLTVNQENAATIKANELAEAEEKHAAAAKKAADTTEVWNSKLRFTSEVVADAEKQVRTLTGEYIKLSDAQKLHDQGGSQTYDFSTQAGRDAVPGSIAQWLHAGYSLAQAAAIDLAMRWHFPLNMNDQMWQTKGPRVPGFAEGVENFAGGWATVGERGPETMYVPTGASIYPHGSGAGGGPTIQLYITQPLGTPAQIAAVVGPALINAMREQGTRF